MECETDNIFKVGFTSKKNVAEGLASLEGKKLKMGVSDLAGALEHINPAISDERYHYWCISAVDDEEGNTHLFVARWPSDVNFDVGWRTVSEIAHFIGESPEGSLGEVGTVFSNENVPEGQTAARAALF